MNIFTILQNDTCYFGNVSYVNEGIDDLPDNLTIYSSQVGIDNMTLYFGEKMDVLSRFWNLYIQEVMDDITLPSCKGLAHLERWHYVVYESGICFLAKIGDNVNHTIDNFPKVSKTIHINSFELLHGTFVIDNFKELVSDRGHNYVYAKYDNTKNIAECGIHCIFDSDEKCDFYYFHDSVCYLGNFNTLAPLDIIFKEAVSNYIHYKNLNDMRDFLYEFEMNVTESKWKSHVVETMTNISTEIECGAFAALYYAQEIDFYRYEGTECFLGDMTSTNLEDTSLTNESLIKVHRSKYLENM